jgi:hypothetical protein
VNDKEAVETYFDQSPMAGSWVNMQDIIKGWQDSLQMMHQGDAWRVYIPSDLGHKDNRVRIFELHLLAVGEWDMGGVKSDLKSEAKEAQDKVLNDMLK